MPGEELAGSFRLGAAEVTAMHLWYLIVSDQVLRALAEDLRVSARAVVEVSFGRVGGEAGSYLARGHVEIVGYHSLTGLHARRGWESDSHRRCISGELSVLVEVVLVVVQLSVLLKIER